MEVKTIREILTWTKHYHEHLEECYAHCSDRAEVEKITLLLDYFKSHQKRLSETLKHVIDRQQDKVLNTWCIAYSVRQTPFSEHVCQHNLSGLSTQEIIVKVIAAHQVIIDLYRELASQSLITDAHELFQSLLDLEEHELILEMDSSNDLESPYTTTENDNKGLT